MEQVKEDTEKTKRYCLRCPMLRIWIALQGDEYRLAPFLIKDSGKVCCKMLCYCDKAFVEFGKEPKKKFDWELALVNRSDLEGDKPLEEIASFQVRFQEWKKKPLMEKYIVDLMAGKNCMREAEDIECHFYAERSLEEWNE